MPEPNEEQKQLIKGTEGIYLVDAGAGTGKTFTVTRRYAHILDEKDVDPDDLLLVTFTRNAAEEMREKILDRSSYDLSALREAPISTFHSYCKSLVENHGFEAPELLGIDEKIPSSTRVVEDEFLEMKDFRRFLNGFMERHGEYDNFFRIVWKERNLLRLVKSLAVKGIVPKEEGWFRKGEGYLDGSYEELKEVAKKVNEPKQGKRGPKNSDLMKSLTGYRKSCLTEDAPSERDLRGGREKKSVDMEFIERAFDEDREELKSFVHDLYYEYLKYCLSRNYMNFAFWMVFAFVILCEEDRLRERLSFEYVMVDEFQDTNEIQLKLTLLLSSRDNICVVGDWKQSIYGFQYATVENIRRFEERIKKYKEELNDDRDRIGYSVEDVSSINLTKNYRSGQDILDFSEQSFTLKGKGGETVDESVMEDVVSLESEKDYTGEITAFESDKEEEAVLERIERIVGNDDYRVPGEDGMRKIDYSDIAVLARNRKFGLELQEKARYYGVPVAFEGGVELFKTDPAILLLAWLRILDWKDSRRGWSVVLEKAGYSLDEARDILDGRDYPEEMLNFKEELEELDRISSITRRVFEKYGINNPFTSKIIEVLDSTFRSTYMSTGDLVRFIEDCIEDGKTYEVDTSREENLVTIQTVHGAKGLEYPVVFISDINEGRFPGRNRGGPVIVYEDPLGLRQKKLFVDDDMPYCYDNWRMKILGKCLIGEYDEERRLMYVAMTRAKNYLFFTADSERKSTFFEGLDIDKEKVEPELEKLDVVERETKELVVEEPREEAPLILPASVLAEDVEGEGRGREFGKAVHRFAERYASGERIEPKCTDEENVKDFLDSLEGELLVEEDCKLPLTVKNRKVVLSGKIDLVVEEEDRIRVVDYKTEKGEATEEEYVKQVSVYYHVLDQLYSEKNVEACIYYTRDGELKEVAPIDLKDIKSFVPA